MQHNIFELIVVTRKRDKNFLINTHTHNGVQKTLPDKSSLCLSLACSRTSFHFLSLRLMKKYYLALPLQLCCSPCLILSILFFISRQLNSALFLYIVKKAFSSCLSIILQKVFSLSRSERE